VSCLSSVCHQIFCSFVLYTFLHIGLYLLAIHFTTHFFEIYFDFFPDTGICQLKCCVQFLFFPYTFCALPQLLLFSLYCLGTGSQAGLLIILLSGVGFSTETVQCPSSLAMAREANCNSNG